MSERVIVTYATPIGFQSSDTWKQVHAGLLSQLPLRNIHWKPTSKSTIRTIQELGISLIPLENQQESVSQVPDTILDKPLLNIYVLTCEDVEQELYRGTLKQQIKDWHSRITQKKNQEWLILHIVKPVAKTQSGSFFALKGSVSDKIKADFNVDKRDRCVQLAWSGQENPTAWADFITKFKDGLLSAFDAVVNQREEEVRKSESQMQMPGWNFCTFFIVKESLAISFEGVKFYEDALTQYDELEATSHQILKERSLSWFGTLISPSPNDDSLPLLSVNRKPYRELILANTISIFDFRIYLLARQCSLLGRMGKICEVGRKVGAFLGGFGRRLREVEHTIPEYFIESWIYSSALSAIEQCDRWVAEQNLDGFDLARYLGVKGELLELARNQLNNVGISADFLPLRVPFTLSLPAALVSEPATPSRPQHKISNKDIFAALASKPLFYERFIALTKAAIDMYVKAGRRKLALKLHGSLAALDIHRERMDSALMTYTSLPAHYAPHMWTSLESFMLSCALDIHAVLGKPKNMEWIHIILSFLKTLVSGTGTGTPLHQDDLQAYVSGLVLALKEAIDDLDPEITHSEHPMASIQTYNEVSLAMDVDGSFLEVTVNNHLPCPLPTDEICVFLTGREAERLKFVANTGTLTPGKTTLNLFCPSSPQGTYLLDSSEIRMSRLVLQYDHRKGKSVTSLNDLVKIPLDPKAVNIQLEQPQNIVLGGTPQIHLKLSTGRNHVLKAFIKVSSSAGTQFQHDKAIIEDKGSVQFTPSKDNLELLRIPRGSAVAILVPHNDFSSLNLIRTQIKVKYWTEDEPSIERTLRLNRAVATSLPIMVNVQDFFRGTRLISRFTVSTTSNQPVRIHSAQLQLPTEIADSVKLVGTTKQRIMTVTPSQPAHFLFHIDSTEGPIRESLKLHIKFRPLREEFDILLKCAILKSLSDNESYRDHVDTLFHLIRDALDDDESWVEMYTVTGELIIPSFLQLDGALGEAVKKLSEWLKENKFVDIQVQNWRSIHLPVDVPQMNVVAAARIFLNSPPKGNNSIYAGQPVSATLSISTSFHWSTEIASEDKGFTLRFDIEELVNQWLVSGRKRGDFEAKHDNTFTVPITLIAVHHGELSLPKVAVTALPIAGESAMGAFAIPSTETYQVHGAEKVTVLPRGGRSTYVIEIGQEGF